MSLVPLTGSVCKSFSRIKKPELSLRGEILLLRLVFLTPFVVLNKRPFYFISWVAKVSLHDTTLLTSKCDERKIYETFSRSVIHEPPTLSLVLYCFLHFKPIRYLLVKFSSININLVVKFVIQG